MAFMVLVNINDFFTPEINNAIMKIVIKKARTSGGVPVGIKARSIIIPRVTPNSHTT
jgi:hypothetical protein